MNNKKDVKGCTLCGYILPCVTIRTNKQDTNICKSCATIIYDVVKNWDKPVEDKYAD